MADTSTPYNPSGYAYASDILQIKNYLENETQQNKLVRVIHMTVIHVVFHSHSKSDDLFNFCPVLMGYPRDSRFTENSIPTVIFSLHVN